MPVSLLLSLCAVLLPLLLLLLLAARRCPLMPLSAACRLNSLFLSRSAPSPPYVSRPFSRPLALSLVLPVSFRSSLSLVLAALYILFLFLLYHLTLAASLPERWKTSGNIAESRPPDFSPPAAFGSFDSAFRSCAQYSVIYC